MNYECVVITADKLENKEIVSVLGRIYTYEHGITWFAVERHDCSILDVGMRINNSYSAGVDCSVWFTTSSGFPPLTAGQGGCYIFPLG